LGFLQKPDDLLFRKALLHVRLLLRKRTLLDSGWPCLQGAGQSGDGPDFFEALSAVRQRLEAHGLLLGCYGASLNVFPSPMARQMGSGLKAYRLTLGQQAKRQDLVRIFDTGPDVRPASVAAQREYFDTWQKSLE
ncbi:hypothetical protein, partial [Burkholderia cenocepacia]|uniref:hypothetical protein n=1 Tax=Burkholderia cenocepacia TaxID=95486 RepID=UPI001ABAB919